MILQKLEPINELFATQKEFMLTSTSLLIVYEGDPKSPLHVNVKLIDFAHVTPSDKGDPGFSFGVSNLIDILREMLA